MNTNILWTKEVRTSEGTLTSLEAYSGHVALVVNTATKCGFAKQFEGLQELYDLYKDQKFTVLAFPSNDFFSQEPLEGAEIQNYCELRYQTTYPIFGKAPVRGTSMQPVYRYLTEESPRKLRGPIRWNFVKFLVGRDGVPVERYSAFRSPLSGRIRRDVEGVLG